MKTIISNTFLIISIGLLSSLFFTACYIFEPYDEIYYHKVGAEGYVYYQNKPVPDVRITVWSHFKSRGKWTTKSPVAEDFTTDATGYFYVKFIRRTGHEDVIYSEISFSNDSLTYGRGYISINQDDIRRSKQPIQLGSINLKKHFK